MRWWRSERDRKRYVNFGRDIDLDLSSPEKEYTAFHFPCSQILKSDAWEMGLNKAYPERFPKYMEFRELILDSFRSYQVPGYRVETRNIEGSRVSGL